MSTGTPALFGVIGVVVGGTLTGLTALMQEWRRRVFEERARTASERREDQLRLEARRFDADLAFVTSANRIYALCKYRRVLPESHQDIRLAYEQFLSTSSPAFLLSAESEGREALARLVHAVRILVDLMQSEDELDPVPARTSALEEHRAAVKAVEQAMRRQLDIA